MARETASLKPLGNGECFLVDLDGHRTIAVRLPTDVASEISGESLLISQGFFTKVKVRLGLASEPESWLAVTSVDNPLLEELDRFKALLVARLTDATGVAVTKSSLSISASVLVNGKEQVFEDDDKIPTHGFRN